MTPLKEDKLHIYDLDLEVLEETLTDWGEPPFRGIQIWQGLYRSLWDKPDQFTHLPKSLRRRLDESFIWERLHPIKFLQSSGGDTFKTLFQLPDEISIEAVLMNYAKRNTLCVSTQAGCALGCVFCATGQMGFRRNLSSGEIVEQVLSFSRKLSCSDNSTSYTPAIYQSSVEKRITNVVFMGMGEPFLNYQNTMAATQRLNQPQGFNLGQRRFTISTVGIVPGIQRFTLQDSQVNVAISLHAADDELRSALVPINRKYPIVDLIESCLEYVDKTNRRVSFEWALIDGLNDTTEQAKKLARLL